MASKGRKKPLHGAKKYSLIPLPCSVKGCDEEFFVCKPDGKRFCESHTLVSLESKAPTGKPAKPVSKGKRETLAILGLL